MKERCYWSCHRTNNVKIECTGLRATFYYPGGGSYKGYWLNCQRHGYGVMISKNGLIYDGQWKYNKRDGYGTMRRPVGQIYERVYVGEWKDDVKCGEGKQFYEDGTYYGWWQNNRRHGLGIMWYKDGRLYIGEWQANVHHGLGVFFYTNGNRYEGSFARGFKNGEGTFYHVHTGQIQKGMWENDVCKAALIQDENRHQVDRPTEYPIPKNSLCDPDSFVCRLFSIYKKNERKPHRCFKELVCLNYVKKMRKCAKYDPLNSKVPTNDIAFPCVCKKIEKLVLLREL